MADLSEGSVSGAPWGRFARGLVVLAVAAATAVLLATPHPVLALLPGLAMAFFLLMEHCPTLAFYGIVALIPFGAYRGPEGQYEFLRLHWILGIVLVLLLFLHCLPRKALRDQLSSNLWPWLGVFFVVSVASALLSAYPAVAFKNVALLIAAYVFIGVALAFVTEHGFRRVLPAVVITSVTASALLSVAGYFFSIPFFASKTAMGSFKRGTGASPDPNNLSLMIVFTLPLVFHWFFHARTLQRRALAGLVLLVNGLAIVTTYSRGGAVVFCIMMAGLLFEYRHRVRPKHLGLIVCGLAALVLFAVSLAPASYWDRVASLAGRPDRAIGRRASYLVVARRAVADRPLLGHGPGTFPKIYAQTELAERYKKEYQSKERFAHNTYAEIAVGSGLIGLAVFAALLLCAWRNFSRAKRHARLRGDMELTVLIGTYRLSYVVLLVYLLLFSDPYHKYLLLSLPLSQVALRNARVARAGR